MNIVYDYDGRKLEISRVGGSGNNSLFHIMIDNYYYGKIWNTELYGWKVALHEDSPLTMDDIDVIIEDIEKATG